MDGSDARAAQKAERTLRVSDMAARRRHVGDERPLLPRPRGQRLRGRRRLCM